MRMWMLNPKRMCRKHLLGEHVEIHMMLGTLRRGKSIDGFLNKKLLQPKDAVARHNEIVAEMNARGFNHQSNILPSDVSMINFDEFDNNYVDCSQAITDLTSRCDECRRMLHDV